MQLKHFLCLIPILLLSESCHKKYTENNIILSAEKVLYTTPDSAYKLLRSIKNPEQLPKADYAAWCLHYTHAKFKLYINEEKDTILLRFASDYFQKNGPDEYAGISLYLKGAMAQLNNKNTQAMSFFKKATGFLEKSNEIQVSGLLYTKIGYLYLGDEFYNESIRNLDIALKYFFKTKNKKYISYIYRLKAECYYRQERPLKKILEESEKSKKYSLEANDSLLYFDNLHFEGKINIDKNNLLAKKTFLTVLKNKKFNIAQTTVLLAYTYAFLNNPDSAKYYLTVNKVDSSDIDILLIYEMTNSKINNISKNHYEAYKHYKEAYNLREKQFNKTNKNLLLKIDKQYDYTQKEKERANLEIANQQKIILIILLSLFIIIGLFVQLQIRNRHKLNQKRMELEQQKMKFEIEFQKSENTQNLTIIQNNIKNKIDNTIKFKRLNIGISNKEKIDDFLTEITQQSFISEKELHYYMIEADKLYGNRISNLKNEFPNLTSIDLIVISLIALGIDLNNCCQLLNISLTSLYTRRKRIKNHLEIDKSINLENWVEQKIIKSEFK